MRVNEDKVGVVPFSSRSTAFTRLLALSFVLVLVTAATANAQHQNQLCTSITNKQLEASSGMQMYCFGAQSNGPASLRLAPSAPGSGSTLGLGSNDQFKFTNVDAGNPAEDKSPNGTEVFGQSETSIAAVGSYVVEAWNDGTGFFSPPCSPSNKDQLTGLGFSSDGGQTFTDLGGLPNPNCATSTFFGDPSVEVLQAGGATYFYVSSLFFDVNGSHIALDECTVIPGPPANLSCNGPIIAASGGFFGFLDKDFMS